MVASVKKPFLTAVADRRAELDANKTPTPEEKQQRTNFKRKLTSAEGKHTEMKAKETELAAETDEKKKAELQRDIFKLVDSIIEILAEVGVTEHDVEKVVLAPPILKDDYIKIGSKALKVVDTNPVTVAGQIFDFTATYEQGGAKYFGKFIDYGTAYTKVPAESLPLAPADLDALRDYWDSYSDANKVMNYRRSGFQLNSDPSHQWEHTVEQSAGFASRQVNTLDNLSWATTAVNQEANRLYGTTNKADLAFLPSAIKDKLYKDIDGVPGHISIREYLKAVTSFNDHKKIKESYYSWKGLSRTMDNISNRGPFYKLE
jgi:hypothetical protein